MKQSTKKIIEKSKKDGWVLEPMAKQLLRAEGLKVTRCVWAKSPEEAARGAKKLGYPVVIKAVSPLIIHKTEQNAVALGINDDKGVHAAFETMSALPGFMGVLVDETAHGREVIIGAKNDPQFGPVVMVGIGGTSVEIYKDVSLRLAPLDKKGALGALRSLVGIELLTGHRGKKGVDINALAMLLSDFSRLAYKLGDLVESIDLNPVFCSAEGAVIADARIMLPTGKESGRK